MGREEKEVGDGMWGQEARTSFLLLSCSSHSDLLSWGREVSHVPRITAQPGSLLPSQVALTPCGFGSSGCVPGSSPPSQPVPASGSANCEHCQQPGHKVKVQKFRIL